MADRLVDGLTPGMVLKALGLVEEILTSGLGRVLRGGRRAGPTRTRLP